MIEILEKLFDRVEIEISRRKAIANEIKRIVADSVDISCSPRDGLLIVNNEEISGSVGMWRVDFRRSDSYPVLSFFSMSRPVSVFQVESDNVKMRITDENRELVLSLFTTENRMQLDGRDIGTELSGMYLMCEMINKRVVIKPILVW